MADITVTIVETTARTVTLPDSTWAYLMGVKGDARQVAEWIRDNQPREVEAQVRTGTVLDTGEDDVWSIEVNRVPLPEEGE